MGIFTACQMVYGVMISSAAHTRLVTSEEFERHPLWRTLVWELADDHWVVGSAINSHSFTGWLDSPLESHELARGWVSAKELKPVVARQLEQGGRTLEQVWTEDRPGDLAEILAYLRIAESAPSLHPRWWFVEIVRTSHHPNDPGSVERRIPIRRDDREGDNNGVEWFEAAAVRGV